MPHLAPSSSSTRPGFVTRRSNFPLPKGPTASGNKVNVQYPPASTILATVKLPLVPRCSQDHQTHPQQGSFSCPITISIYSIQGTCPCTSTIMDTPTRSTGLSYGVRLAKYGSSEHCKLPRGRGKHGNTVQYDVAELHEPVPCCKSTRCCRGGRGW